MNPSISRRTSRSRVAVLAVVLALSTASASETESQPESKADPEPATAEAPPTATLDDLRAFSDSFNIVRRHYVDELPDRQLIDSALRGMMSGLDAYSSFLGPEAFQTQDDNAKGREGGVGIRLEAEEGRLIVAEVYPDGPAWLAGVQAGDRLLAVDGDKVRGRRLSRSRRAVLGEPGTDVTLRLRTGDMKPRDVTLERAYVPVPSVRGELLDGDIALLSLDRFHLATADEFERRLKWLADDARGPLRGVVVDLRGNLGGMIESAAKIADGFLDEGLVVYTRGRFPASKLEYQALPGQWIPDLPLVVLVDELSASASEILAGALQDHERATIVGTRTYGKGTVQSIIRLRNGSALKLTTARYYTPAGRSFDGAGIEPDVLVPAAEAGDQEPNSRGDGDQGADLALASALALFREGKVADGTSRR